MLKKLALSCLLAAASFNSSMAADALAMPETVANADYKVAGVALDIRGLAIGMTRQQAEEKILEIVPRQSAKTSKNAFSFKGVTSAAFTDRIVSWEGQDQFEILLSSPTSGNTVIMVARSAEIPVLQQPKIEEMTSALVKKYGKTSDQIDGENSRTVMWYIGKSAACAPMLLECVEPTWRAGTGMEEIVYSPSKLAEYAAYAEGADVIIVARLDWKAGEDRVSKITLSITDAKTRAETAAADMKLVEAELIKKAQ